MSIKMKSAWTHTPPSNKELLVKSPSGLCYIANYRRNHGIFDCQNKRESVEGWYWCELDVALEKDKLDLEEFKELDEQYRIEGTKIMQVLRDNGII